MVRTVTNIDINYTSPDDARSNTRAITSHTLTRVATHTVGPSRRVASAVTETPTRLAL